MMVLKKQIKPLSGRGKNIEYEKANNKYKIKWGEQKDDLILTETDFQMILNKYFIDENNWYPLGANMDKPISGGLGEFLTKNFEKLTPRHASAIAAIMHNENLILAKEKKLILLKKI